LSKPRTPVIVVNFKAYTEVEGPRALALAQACQEVSDESGASIVACPPVIELSSVIAGVTIPVFSQHTDPKKPGAATGFITPEMIKAAGAAGSLLNHSEHRMVLSDLAMVVERYRDLGLTSLVCADTSITSAAAAALGPDMVAVEPPELIGGDISVTDANPEIVEMAVRAVRRVDDGIDVLCGAGIKNGKDVKRAVELGASGVLLASGIVKSKDPRGSLSDLVRYL
jgi:triosephosphate isomerase (TIM)